MSVEDPEPAERRPVDHADEATVAALLGRASLSGIQRKLLVVKNGKTFRPVGPDELSTHIAKLRSGNLADLLELEYLTTRAVRALLPGDDIVDMELVHLPAVKEDALIIPRFDRTATGKRLHFEEFNQLIGKYSGDAKYEGAYEDMGQFILRTPGCIPAEADRLLQRVLACLLIGNTDAHFKNFAMFHRRDGLRLAPAYDLVAASCIRIIRRSPCNFRRKRPCHRIAASDARCHAGGGVRCECGCSSKHGRSAPEAFAGCFGSDREVIRRLQAGSVRGHHFAIPFGA